ncbi:hypothetical protein FLONG3_5282 [Fusarium longipes]|uniref:Uncharacterized protein n=1 Tax=Fusarium longipes TaxID=694270 RepID=A0A395SV74_9HYPO|nr:hypothetical protein FLONG3_5282 [Fusarium longipes]
MKLIWAFAALFAVASANHLGHQKKKDFTIDYNWECGKVLNSTMWSGDCVYLLTWLGSGPKAGWWTTGLVGAYGWTFRSCEVFLKAGPPHSGINIRGDEFAELTQWVHGEMCDQKGQRTMITPKNSSWTAWITEPGWDNKTCAL